MQTCLVFFGSSEVEPEAISCIGDMDAVSADLVDDLMQLLQAGLK